MSAVIQVRIFSFSICYLKMRRLKCEKLQFYLFYVKVKAIPVQTWTGPGGFRRL